ncbi:MAG: hypothetical protein J7J09_00980 [Kosmotoga sp.]|uniref:PSP1 domain-containing protein n=1 Tax=Kosmotoga sp. TaxID=1955248 RepID=UPI001DD87F37|nr:regulatory iron-sulfur-containing complex subunit RicT [Kosmotoga sp.]MBO8166836.1 hypothetical protein [Kosmotoga sp.]MCD6159187.1 hypothetical protein [Kosmotoga sp.]
MPEIYGNVCGVEFHPVGKLYLFTVDNQNLKPGDKVIAETEFGLDVGTVRHAPVKMRIDQIEDIKPILRKMTTEDEEKHKKNQKDSKDAFEQCLKKIKEHQLPMRLLEARYMFDRSRIVFYFGADSRVDFRELVKDLARMFKIRIELRQVGIRDEVKMKGSMGLCGQLACCVRFKREFESITLKHAKKQQLLINPAKISGRCGRLLCCLAYEQQHYEEELRDIPDEGSLIEYDGKTCKLLNVNIFLKQISMVTDEGNIIKVPFDEFRKKQGLVIGEVSPEELIKNKDEDIRIDEEG